LKRELIYNYYPILVSESFMGIYMFNKANSPDSYTTNPIKPTVDKNSTILIEKDNKKME